MGLFSTTKSTFPWEQLTSTTQLEGILNSSETSLIFKHSTRCSISSMALKSFEREFNADNKIKCYFLDLLNHRALSDEIAHKTNIQHQSPQVIVLRNKELIYNASHEQIDAGKINTL